MEGKTQMQSFALSMTTLGRVSVPDDVSNAVSFLSGSDSDWVTGQVGRPLIDPDWHIGAISTDKVLLKSLVVDGGIAFN